MKYKLPVLIEDNELTINNLDNNTRNNNSLGYVSVLYIISILVTSFSVAVVIMVLGK